MCVCVSVKSGSDKTIKKRRYIFFTNKIVDR